MYLLQPPLRLREGSGIRSIFKWSKAGLNSEFSFFLTGCFIKAKELSLLFTNSREWMSVERSIHTFPKGISTKWNALRFRHVKDLNSGHRLHNDNRYAKRISVIPSSWQLHIYFRRLLLVRMLIFKARPLF